jgi:hypothetical protein
LGHVRLRGATNKREGRIDLHDTFPLLAVCQFFSRQFRGSALLIATPRWIIRDGHHKIVDCSPREARSNLQE